MAQRRAARRRRRRRRRTILPVLVCLAFVVLIIYMATILFQKVSVNNKRMDPSVYYGIGEDEAAIIVDDRILELKGIIREGEIYLPYGAVWNTLNSSFYWESTTEQLLLTLPAGTLAWSVGDGSGVLLKEGGKLYVSASCIRENSDIDMEILDQPKRVIARTKWTNLAAETVTEDTVVRVSGNPKSEVLTEVKDGDTVVLTENGQDWCKVSTADGYVGYVKKSLLTEAPEGVFSHTTDERFIFKKIQVDYPIVMAWQYTSTRENNDEFDVLTQNAAGLNTVAPIWFRYSNADGDLESLAEKSYVDHAHQAGMTVWGTFSDVSGGELTSGSILKTLEARSHVIGQLLAAAEETGMDGINIDIEHLTEDDIPQYLQFLRELCVAAHEKNIIVSTDNYVPQFTAYYNRREQAKFVDYIVIMGYDEHVNGSAEAGSVASLPYVEKGIQDTLAEVPASQVINAIPFYTRGWTSLFGQERPDSEAFGMNEADTFAETHGIYLSWDPSVGQRAGTAVTDAARYSIWMEDEQSVEEKMKLIVKYKLAGVGAWRLGFERDSVWPVINSYMNG